MNFKKTICLLFVTTLISTAICAQNNLPFQKEIDAFAKADSICMPDAGSILFVGSSSFNYWKDIKDYFPGYSIINRGFGGSSLTDLIYYSTQTIVKYKPKQIYIYCGENDIAASDTVSPETVLSRFKQLFEIIRTKLDPNTLVDYVSIKPSVARWQMESRMLAANSLIKSFLANQKHSRFIDVHTAMLDANGQVFKDIFIGDNLHMNAKGYKIWQKIIAPTLLKSDAPVVQTQSGKVAGYKEGNIEVFKGIPFAAPPVGNLRWKAPQPAPSWEGIKTCIQFGPSPVQAEPIPFMCWSKEYLIPKEPIDEDCLYLNVWSKPTVKKKPVLVYIYGGGFRSGGAACPIYDGKAIAEKDVVFVSINYRVGVFGFLAHPELSKEASYGASGNYALLDMIAALQWVKQNIASFGGDPSQVTIAGQSAGAFAVNHLCATPLAKGLFRGAIAQSGGSVLPSSFRPNLNLKDAERLGIQFAQSFHVNSIEALRNIPANEILKSNIGLSAPIEDGYVLPTTIAEIYKKGIQNDVTLMLGWNEDDRVSGPPTSAVNYIAQIEKKYGINAQKVLSFYPATDDKIAANSQADLSRDETFAVQGYAWANAQNKTGKSKVYLYNFNRKLPAYDAASDFGAFHTGEVVYVFDNLKTVDRPWENTDQVLAKQLSNYWVNFVKTNNPNGNGLVQWNAYDSERAKVLIMNNSIESKKLPTQSQLQLLTTLF
mgnify:CR=1 FL=1